MSSRVDRRDLDHRCLDHSNSAIDSGMVSIGTRIRSKLRSLKNLVCFSECLSSPSKNEHGPSSAPGVASAIRRDTFSKGSSFENERFSCPDARQSVGSEDGDEDEKQDQRMLKSALNKHPHFNQHQQHHQQQWMQGNRRGRLSSSQDSSSSVANSKPSTGVQNIYRKPLSRKSSSSGSHSLRMSAMFRSQRFLRHVVMWDSDPGEIGVPIWNDGKYVRMERPSFADQCLLDPEKNDDSNCYRRRVYTMPSSMYPVDRK